MPQPSSLRLADWLRAHWLESVWAVFVVANAAVLLTLGQWETIPFHFIWLSLTILYFFRPWSFGVTAAVLAGVCVVAGVSLGWVVARGPQGPDELAEVPMMAAIYAVMVWHARRGFESMDRLQRVIGRQRDFVRDASHMLRTPITVAQGHAELIRLSSEGSQTRADAEIILDELKRLSDISDRLLLLASAEDPKFIAHEDIDLERLLRELARRWLVTARRTWEVQVAVEGSIVGDEKLLTFALDELIENALRATEEDDLISIVGTHEGDTAVIEISDSGIGIRPEDLDQIFEEFSRSTLSRRRGGRGTGLGLPIVKAIVEAHGGCIEVESEPGRGSTFRIGLDGFRPRSEPAAPALAGDLVGSPS